MLRDVAVVRRWEVPEMSTYGRKAHTNMDILYLLLPIIGAFLLLFLVCCFGKKVKEMLHIPKELVLGRHFPGIASSSTSSSTSSQSSFSDSEDEGDVEPSLIINVNMEQQRVLSQYRRRYTQVPSDEMVFNMQGEGDAHMQQPPQCVNSRLAMCRVPFFNNHQHIHRKSKNQKRRADSCPLLSDFSKDDTWNSDIKSCVNVIHSPYRFQNNLTWRHDSVNTDLDSDSDVPDLVYEKPDRRRHRSNSESDLPKRCSQCDIDNSLTDQRFSHFSHQLSSTEFQLHAMPDCAITVPSECEQCSSNHAEVG